MELKEFVDKNIHLKINGGRAVDGIPQGFVPFMIPGYGREMIKFAKSVIGMVFIIKFLGNAQSQGSDLIELNFSFISD